jgi:hypothetical protein
MRVPSLEASYADHLEGVNDGSLGSVLLGNGHAPGRFIDAVTVGVRLMPLPRGRQLALRGD